ncbi:MAG: hypothetical protein LBT21_02580 [Oscillospiraceae bacterium]|jgi:hypothetical protein|nr:hypothetical protein [Oscillospiraceae bacterium]
MADNNSKGTLFAWLNDGNDDFFSIVDFITEFVEVLSDTSPDGGSSEESGKTEQLFGEDGGEEYFVPAAEPVLTAAAVGAGTAAAAATAADAVTHVWDEPAAAEEFIPEPAKKRTKKLKQPKEKTAEVVAEAAQVVEDWQTDEFGIREDSRPLEIFDSILENLDPEA